MTVEKPRSRDPFVALISVSFCSGLLKVKLKYCLLFFVVGCCRDPAAVVNQEDEVEGTLVHMQDAKETSRKQAGLELHLTGKRDCCLLERERRRARPAVEASMCLQVCGLLAWKGKEKDCIQW